MGGSDDWKYSHEASVRKTPNTPLFCDEVWVDGWPQETDGPSKDLYNGSDDTFMGRYTIARHLGRAPGLAPRNITSSAQLVGGVEMAFMDGHAGPECCETFGLWIGTTIGSPPRLFLHLNRMILYF